MDRDTKRKSKRKNRFSWISLGLAVLFIGTGLLLQKTYYNATYGERDVDRFEDVLHGKERLIRNEFGKLQAAFSERDPLKVLGDRSPRFRRLSQKEGIYLFYFNDGTLSYWSDHGVPIPARWNRRMEDPVMELRNAVYVAEQQETANGMLLGLIQVKTQYPYENDYLENGFHPDFHMEAPVPLSRIQQSGMHPVFNMDGDYLFAFDFDNRLKQQGELIPLAVVAFLAGFIFLFVFLCLKVSSRNDRKARLRWVGWGVFLTLLVAALIIVLEQPRILFASVLFHPSIFASMTFHSLGHLLLVSAVVFMAVLMLYRYVDLPSLLGSRLRWPVSVILLLLASVGYVFLHHVLSILVIDSNISFEAYKVNTLDEFTFIGLLILALLFMAVAMVIDRALSLESRPFSLRQGLTILITTVIVQVPFLGMVVWRMEIFSLVFYLFFIGAIAYIRYRKVRKLPFSRFFLVLFLFALFTSLELQKHTSFKVRQNKEVEAVKLSSEHDAVAEMLFSSVSRELRKDSTLMRRLSSPYLDIDYIYNYLQRTYFTGYWTKYDLQITLCHPADSVYVQPPDDAWFHCYSFFGEMIREQGIEVPNSDFYFLDNLNGRISYLAQIPYSYGEEREISLFLELDSKIISEELGYPELLLKDDYETDNGFSHAKYNGGKLITSSGDYDYRRTSDYYTNGDETFERLVTGQFEHLVFNVDEENTIIVTSRMVSFIDKLISFSYIFAYFFVLLALFYLFISPPQFRSTLQWNFKNRIQYSMIGILFLTFVFICSGTIYFIIQQYRDKHHDNLQNTMRSVYIELIHKVEFEEDLRNWSSDKYYDLDELLRKFSNVFYADINLYDEEGMLLSTSRSEIFEQHLLSRRMNRVAFEKLAIEDYSAFIHTENIGNLQYQSAYVPLLNSENNLLAYLNLPYFTHPEALTQDITNLIVAILNIYVILLLLILFVSVFLADRITQPLRMIQNRIAQVSLSVKNEKIVYRRQDEIRGLVEEYNYMVDELARSAELLAQSERETAWREMAKQIAHEIKNPLTPMKLNVQHLQRTLLEGDGNREEKVNNVCRTLIEQINSLSSIANEFSDFAKMPRARYERINLVKKLQNTLELFSSTGSVNLELDTGTWKEVWVYGDKEQLMRVFINLIKNGMQSVPDTREAHISITMEKVYEGKVQVTVADNGRGIPEEIRDKLFRPNFTTKSSGMGMGLAITANIIKAMGGDIRYETESGEGSTFYVTLPVYQ